MKLFIPSSLIKLMSGIILIGVMATNATASEKLPDIELIVPEQQEYRDYLGLATGTNEKFKLNEIKADIVIIELFSMYCSFCQAEAPRVNELYERLRELEEHRNIIVRMVGLGASNSEFEVEHFKQTYQVKFPMFPDKDLSKYNILKGEGTPGFIVVVQKEGSEPEIVLRNSGGFDSASDFMKELLAKSGY